MTYKGRATAPAGEPRPADRGHRMTYNGRRSRARMTYIGPRRRQQVTDPESTTAGAPRARAPGRTARGPRTRAKGPRRSIPRRESHGPRAGGRRPDSRRGGPRARGRERGALEHGQREREGRPGDRYRRAGESWPGGPGKGERAPRAGKKKGPVRGPRGRPAGAGPRTSSRASGRAGQLVPAREARRRDRPASARVWDPGARRGIDRERPGRAQARARAGSGPGSRGHLVEEIAGELFEFDALGGPWDRARVRRGAGYRVPYGLDRPALLGHVYRLDALGDPGPET